MLVHIILHGIYVCKVLTEYVSVCNVLTMYVGTRYNIIQIWLPTIYSEISTIWTYTTGQNSPQKCT